MNTFRKYGIFTIIDILKQCQALIDLSPDTATLINSKYGFLRFSSLHSLSTIRKHWTLYVGTKDFQRAKWTRISKRQPPQG